MNDREEVERELEKLKEEKIVSEKTAQVYLSELRMKLSDDSESSDSKED